MPNWKTPQKSSAVFRNGLIKNQRLPIIKIALAQFAGAHIIQNEASVSAERPARTTTGRLWRNEKNKFSKRTEEPIEKWSEVTAG